MRKAIVLTLSVLLIATASSAGPPYQATGTGSTCPSIQRRVSADFADDADERHRGRPLAFVSFRSRIRANCVRQAERSSAVGSVCHPLATLPFPHSLAPRQFVTPRAILALRGGHDR